jgi:hypothetical protein
MDFITSSGNITMTCIQNIEDNITLMYCQGALESIPYYQDVHVALQVIIIVCLLLLIINMIGEKLT